MTPKEKANDLVNQYRMILMNEDTDCANEILCTSIAIKNALITVHQILTLGKKLPLEVLEYYVEVKIEIEKL